MRILAALLFALLFTVSSCSEKKIDLKEWRLRNTYVLFLKSLSTKDSEDVNLALLERFYPDKKTQRKILQSRKSGFAEALKELLLTPPNKDVLFTELKREGALAIKLAAKKPQRRSQLLGWSLAYVLQSNLNLYQATGEIRFLKLFAELYSQAIMLSDSQNDWKDAFSAKVLHAWSSDTKNGKVAKLTHTGRLAYVAAQFIDHVQSLPEDTELQHAADEYLKFIEKALLAFDHDFVKYTDDGIDYCYYKVNNPGNEKWNGQPHPFNHVSFIGAAHAVLADIREDVSHKQRVECLANYWLKHTDVTDNGALTWPYAATRANKLPEQTWKAVMTIILPVEAYSRGIYFSEEQMGSIVRTFEETVLDKNGVKVRLPGKDKRTFEDLIGHEKYGKWVLYADSAIVRWMPLSLIHPNIRKQILEQAVKNTQFFRTSAWFGSLGLVEAYSLLFLLDSKNDIDNARELSMTTHRRIIWPYPASNLLNDVSFASNIDQY